MVDTITIIIIVISTSLILTSITIFTLLLLWLSALGIIDGQSPACPRSLFIQPVLQHCMCCRLCHFAKCDDSAVLARCPGTGVFQGSAGQKRGAPKCGCWICTWLKGY